MKEIYLDFNATTPVDSRVAALMTRILAEEPGNASSSLYESAFSALDLVEEARGEIAALLGVHRSEIYLMSGATEANNWIAAAASWRSGSQGHVITTAIEHESVLSPLRLWERRGRIELTVCPVESNGIVSVGRIADALRPETVLVSVQAASNEIHTLQPLAEIASELEDHPALFYTDAAQIVGKLPFSPAEVGVDAIGMSSHKLYGPKGVGGVWLSPQIPPHSLEPLLIGGGQERGLRAGTYNTPGIVGFGEAARLCRLELEVGIEPEHSRTLRDRLLEGVLSRHPGAQVNGDLERRLPGGISVQLPGFDISALAQGPVRIACSQSSACASRSTGPSHVLNALGLTTEEARQTLRLSVGRFTSNADVDDALIALEAAATKSTVCGVLCGAPEAAK